MSRRAIYITVFSIIFLYNFLGYHLEPGEGYLSAMMPAAMWGVFFCLFPFAYFQWKDKHDTGPAPGTGNPPPSNHPPGTDTAIPKNYAQFFAMFLTWGDNTKKSKENNLHYAKIREVDNALGGAFKSPTDPIEAKTHILECCLQVQIDKTSYNDADAQIIIDDMVTPLCPAGYLYVGGGFHWNGQGHILTVGAARSGKGASLVVPALLSPLLRINAPNTPSFVVLDPKGENLAIAGRYLKEAGYNVVVVNPFNIPQINQFETHGFNIFDTFSADDDDFGDYLDMISYGLIPKTGGKDSFWEDSGRNIMRLYIRHMMTQDEEPKNFRTLYKWLSLTEDKRLDLLGKMAENLSFDCDISDRALSIAHQLSTKDGAKKTIEGYYEQLQTAIEFLSDGPMIKWLSKNDFDLTTLSKERTALFLCLEPRKLKTLQPFMRVIIGAVMRSLYRHYSKTRKVIMIMDEFIQMGRLEEFEVFSNFGAGIGAGVTLWPIVQSLTDLQRVYPEAWQTFVNNTIIRHYLKVVDNSTAKYIHERMPIIEEKTYIGEPPMKPVELHRIEKELENPLLRAAGGASAQWRIIQLKEQWQKDIDAYERNARIDKRPLLTLNDILNLDLMLVEIDGCSKPALFQKGCYYDYDQLGLGFADPNPFRS